MLISADQQLQNQTLPEAVSKALYMEIVKLILKLKILQAQPLLGSSQKTCPVCGAGFDVAQFSGTTGCSDVYTHTNRPLKQVPTWAWNTFCGHGAESNDFC